MRAKETPETSESESVLARWSRRKRQAARSPEERDQTSDHAPPLVSDESSPVPREDHAPPPGDADMPPLESLGAESDYSGFMSPGVSEELRRLALRKLFHSPLYNITDGLDDYDDDFTSFAVLREAFHARRGEASASESTPPEGVERETAGDAGRAPPARAASAEIEQEVEADSTIHPGGEAVEAVEKEALPEPATRTSDAHPEVSGAADSAGEGASANGGPRSDDADAPAGPIESEARHLSSAGFSGGDEEAEAAPYSSADPQPDENAPAESLDERERTEDCDAPGHEPDGRLRHG